MKILPVEKGKHKFIMIEKYIYLTKFNSNKGMYLINSKFANSKVKNEGMEKKIIYPK